MDLKIKKDFIGQSIKYKRVKTVCDELECRRVTLWRLVRDGKYPKPFKLNGQNIWPIDAKPIFDE